MNIGQMQRSKMIVPAAALLPALVLRILSEEKMLERELGEYAQYQQKVRYRLIPGIW